MRRTAVVLVAGASLLLGACSPGEPGDTGGAATPSVGAGWFLTPSADPSATEDIPGTLACGTLAAAINDATVMNPGVVDAIVAASGTADAPIADAADRLRTAYTAAAAVTGTDDEPDAVAKVSAAAAEMSEICGESGLDTVG